MGGNLYKEKDLSLSNRKLTLFEAGRESGAIADLFELNEKIRLQDRALAEIISMLVKSRKRELVNIVFFAEKIEFIKLVITYRFGYLDRSSIRLFSNSDLKIPSPSMFVSDVSNHYNDIITKTESFTEITKHCKSGFTIVLLPALSDGEQRSAINFFCEFGRQGAIFIKDFAVQGNKWPFMAYRDYGYELVESAEGFGYLYFLSEKIGGFI
jgi:hypothetical protein